MYSVQKQTLVEEVLPPKKLLFLCDAALTETAPAIADCIGTILCSYPSGSPNYMRETAVVWARYRPATDDRGDPTYGELRLRYATAVFEGLPRVTAPFVPPHHCRALVALLTRVAALTSFSRTGDQMVHKLIMSMVEPHRAAELSTRDAPYHLAAETFGDSVNRVVRALFERDIEVEFIEKAWETSASIADFIVFVYILIETGEDIGLRLCCNHEVAFLEARRGISFFCWDGRVGFVAQERVVYADPGCPYPIPALVLCCLEMLAISGYGGMSAAESLLCAVKTPEKARSPARFFPAAPANRILFPSATDECPGESLPLCPRERWKGERRCQ